MADPVVAAALRDFTHAMGAHGCCHWLGFCQFGLAAGNSATNWDPLRLVRRRRKGV